MNKAVKIREAVLHATAGGVKISTEIFPSDSDELIVKNATARLTQAEAIFILSCLIDCPEAFDGLKTKEISIEEVEKRLYGGFHDVFVTDVETVVETHFMQLLSDIDLILNSPDDIDDWD